MAETRRSAGSAKRWRHNKRCPWVLLSVLLFFLLHTCQVLCPASALPYPASDQGYLDGNYTIFSYHLPESEDDFDNDASDARTLDDDTIFANESSSLWADDQVTESPFSPPDHVGDEMENAQILETDYDEEEEEEEEKEGGKSSHKAEEDEEDEDETDKDVVQKFLEQVEKYERNKANCTAGTHHNLGKGVIKQYGLNRFKAQALVAVNRANFLSRIWKQGLRAILNSEYFFFTQVRSMVEGDPEIFAAGNCYDKEEFKDYYLFCPYAYRTGKGTINVKDLSVEYDYLGNSSEWFYTARQRASHLSNFTVAYG